MSDKKESKAKSTKVRTTQGELRKEGGTPKPEIRYALGIEIKIIPNAGFLLNLLGRGKPIVGEQSLLTTKLINLGSDVIPELKGTLKANVYWEGLTWASIEPLLIPKLEPSFESQIFKQVLLPPKSGGAWVEYTTTSNVELWKADEIKADEIKGKYEYHLERPRSGRIQFHFYVKSKEEIAQMILIWFTFALILVAVAQILLLIL